MALQSSPNIKRSKVYGASSAWSRHKNIPPRQTCFDCFPLIVTQFRIANGLKSIFHWNLHCKSRLVLVSTCVNAFSTCEWQPYPQGSLRATLIGPSSPNSFWVGKTGANHVWKILRPAPYEIRRRTFLKVYEVHDNDACWLEKTGTRTSVSAGKRKLKMQSVGRSTTTTTLNVNTNVNCDVRSQQSLSRVWNNARSYYLSRTSSFIDDEEFFVLSDVFEWKKHLLSVQRLFNLQPEWDPSHQSPSVCQSLDLEKGTFWCDSCFPYKVYFLYSKDIWFGLPKYVQINFIDHLRVRSLGLHSCCHSSRARELR